MRLRDDGAIKMINAPSNSHDKCIADLARCAGYSDLERRQQAFALDHSARLQAARVYAQSAGGQRSGCSNHA
jgi:hypothetical protein